MILDGKLVSNKIKEELKDYIQENNLLPKKNKGIQIEHPKYVVLRYQEWFVDFELSTEGRIKNDSMFVMIKDIFILIIFIIAISHSFLL